MQNNMNEYSDIMLNIFKSWNHFIDVVVIIHEMRLNYTLLVYIFPSSHANEKIDKWLGSLNWQNERICILISDINICPYDAIKRM